MILLYGGTVVTPRESFQASVLMDGGKIARVLRCGDAEKGMLPTPENVMKELRLTPECVRIEDVTGRLLFPGFIDAHTHFDLHVAGTVTCDDFQSGTRAAIGGGTTTIIDFGTAYPGESLKQGMQNWLQKTADGVYCDFGIHMTITDWNEEIRRECADMMDAGISTFKVYLTYDTMIDDRTLYEVLVRLKEVGGITGCHCENAGLIDALRDEYIAQGKGALVSSHYLTRPAAAEAEAISRYLRMAQVADAAVIDVHLTCGEGLKEIRAARERGQTVYAETCPQYLTMTRKCMNTEDFSGAKYVCAPPLRTRMDIDALWKAVADGEIQTIYTDHCAFTLAQKELGKEDFRKIPGGMPGVEYRGEVIYSEGVVKGRISREKMCEVLSENVAKLYGLYPRKGVIAEGADADIVVLNPQGKRTISARTQLSRCDYAPLEGLEITGTIEKVYLRGQLAAQDRNVTEEKRGRFLRRERFRPLSKIQDVFYAQ